jgi:hypothetical protein
LPSKRESAFCDACNPPLRGRRGEEPEGREERGGARGRKRRSQGVKIGRK